MSLRHVLHTHTVEGNTVEGNTVIDYTVLSSSFFRKHAYPYHFTANPLKTSHRTPFRLRPPPPISSAPNTSMTPSPLPPPTHSAHTSLPLYSSSEEKYFVQSLPEPFPTSCRISVTILYPSKLWPPSKSTSPRHLRMKTDSSRPSPYLRSTTPRPHSPVTSTSSA